MASGNLLALAVVGTVPLAVMLAVGLFITCFCCCCYSGQSSWVAGHGGSPGLPRRRPTREENEQELRETANTRRNRNANANLQPPSTPPPPPTSPPPGFFENPLANGELNELQYRSPPSYDEIFKNGNTGNTYR